FPFSPRRGTPAATMPDQLAAEEKKERCARLAELEQRLARRYHQALLGKSLSVLVEARPAKRAGCVLGTACRYVPVELPGAAGEVGELVEVTADLLLESAVGGSRREQGACLR